MAGVLAAAVGSRRRSDCLELSLLHTGTSPGIETAGMTSGWKTRVHLALASPLHTCVDGVSRDIAVLTSQIHVPSSAVNCKPIATSLKHSVVPSLRKTDFHHEQKP